MTISPLSSEGVKDILIYRCLLIYVPTPLQLCNEACIEKVMLKLRFGATLFFARCICLCNFNMFGIRIEYVWNRYGICSENVWNIYIYIHIYGKRME